MISITVSIFWNCSEHKTFFQKIYLYSRDFVMKQDKKKRKKIKIFSFHPFCKGNLKVGYFQKYFVHQKEQSAFFYLPSHKISLEFIVQKSDQKIRLLLCFFQEFFFKFPFD